MASLTEVEIVSVIGIDIIQILRSDEHLVAVSHCIELNVPCHCKEHDFLSIYIKAVHTWNCERNLHQLGDNTFSRIRHHAGQDLIIESHGGICRLAIFPYPRRNCDPVGAGILVNMLERKSTHRHSHRIYRSVARDRKLLRGSLTPIHIDAEIAGSVSIHLRNRGKSESDFRYSSYIGGTGNVDYSLSRTHRNSGRKFFRRHNCRQREGAESRRKKSNDLFIKM